MNKRIRELAEQAGYNPLSPSTFADELNEIFMRKFAELIVQECLSIAKREHKNALEFEWDNDDTAQTIRDSISEHFGVNE
jgi:hypothetical protein